MFRQDYRINKIFLPFQPPAPLPAHRTYEPQGRTYASESKRQRAESVGHRAKGKAPRLNPPTADRKTVPVEWSTNSTG